MAKELAYNKQGTKKAQDAWQKKLRENTGQSNDDTSFEILESAIKKAVGEKWWSVLTWMRNHPDQQVDNILALMAKSTRKTKIVKFWQHYLLSTSKWLHAYDLRRTKELSKDKLIGEHMDALVMWSAEYDTPWIRDVIQKGSSKMFFVRDKKRKDNQEIAFGSFDGLKGEGGFTKPYIFHWEELVDPDSIGSAPSWETFKYVLNLVNSKNEENFLSAGIDWDKFGAKNFFTMNRWDTSHPLVEFAEAHAPWEPVKELFLDDLVENNFFVHYVGEPKEGWEEMANTLIVYGTKFSNHLLIKNENWLKKQLKYVESGSAYHLGVILGDIFEGDDSKNKLMSFKEQDVYFHHQLPNTPVQMNIGIDIDANEEVPLVVKTLHKFDSGSVILKYGKPVYAIITNKVYLNPSTKKGWNSVKYNNIIRNQLLNESVSNPSIIKTISTHIDDDKKMWIHPFQRDKELKAHGISPILAKKHGYWGINNRVEYTKNAIPSGFESFIDNKECRLTLREILSIKKNPHTGLRDEDKGRNKLNKANAWEYSSAIWNVHQKSFPSGFWEWYYGEKKKHFGTKNPFENKII